MDIQYTNELHRKYVARTVASANRVIPLVLDVTSPSSVVDVGCGHGHWLKRFLERGITDVLGIDGAYVNAEELVIPRDRFQVMDLNQPVHLDRRFDLAVSLEVAEHLKPTSSEPFVSFLTSLSDRVLFSAGIPGQPGDFHINARWPSFWRELFEQRGYVALDYIRPRIWHDEDVMLCYRQNTYVMVKRDALDADSRMRVLPRANCLTLVDEDALRIHLGWKATLRRAIGRVMGRHHAGG
jgi:SAM-dependent methyltransferase